MQKKRTSYINTYLDMTEIKSISKIKMFLNYSWIFLIPVCLLTIVAIIVKVYFIILVVVLLFLVVAFINFKLKGVTHTVNITENKLIIKRSQIFELDFEDVTMHSIVIRSWFKGLSFQEGKKKVIIWKHEFEKADWEKIKKELEEYYQTVR